MVFGKGETIENNDVFFVESIEIVRRMFDYIPDMVSIIDKDMNILYCNWRGFGSIPEEARILNSKCYKIFRGSNEICSDCQARRVISEKASFTGELQLSDGKHYELRVIPILNDKNRVECFVEWVRDITKLKDDIIELQSMNFALNTIKETAIIFAGKKNREDIFPLITKTFKELTGGTSAIFTLYDPRKKCTRIKYADIEKGMFSTLIKILGNSRILESEYPLSDSIYQEMLENPVREFDSLHEASFGAIPKIAATVFQRLQGIESFIGLAFFLDKQLYGTSLVALPANKKHTSAETIESLVQIFSLTLHRIIAEEDLRKTEENYRTLANNAPDVIVRFDRSLNVSFINQKGRDEFRVNSDQVIGKSLRSLALSEEVTKKWECGISTVFLSRKTETVELERKGEQGTKYYTSLLAPEFSEEGIVTSVLSITRDITQSRLTVKKLEESQRQLSTLMSNLPGMVYRCKNDANWTMVFVSKGSLALTGYKAEELVGNPDFSFPEIVFPEDRPYVRRAVRNGLREKRPFEIIFRITSADNKKKWVLEQGQGIFDSQGNLLYHEGFITDITDRMVAEKELEENRRRLSTLMSNLPGMAYRCSNDPDWTMEFVSEGCFPLTGLKAEELINNVKRSFANIIHQEDKNRVWDSVQAGLTEKKTFEIVYRIITADNKEKWVWEQGQGIFDKQDNLVALEGFISDITESKKAEKRQEALYEISKALNKTDRITDLCDQIRYHLGKVIDTTNFYVALYNEKNDTIRLVYNKDVKHDEYREFPAGKTLTKFVISRARPLLVTEDLLTKLITEGSVELLGLPFKIWLGVPLIAEGKVIGLIAVQSYSDPGLYTENDTKILSFVSEEIGIALKRRETAQRLRENRDRINRLSEQSRTFFWETDPEGLYTYVSHLTEEILGYKPEELIGKKHFFDLHPQEGLKKFQASVFDIINDRKGIINFETRMQRKDGVVIWIDSQAVPMFDSIGNYLGHQGSDTDITELKLIQLERAENEKIKEQLTQSQKMYAIGELTSSIAHDFNNMLMIILNRTEIALKKSKAGETYHDTFLEIKQTAEKSFHLTRQLLGFARKQKREIKHINPNEGVEKTIRLLKRIIPPDVNLDWQPDNAVWQIRLDEAHISQIVLNLCINARDAIAGEGKIKVRLQNTVYQEKPYVLLTVRDDGCGMKEEIREKIFDTFFTTKGEEKGTGLGLATVSKIVNENNGFIEVTSQPGEGSCFYIYFPRNDTKKKRIEESVTDPEKTDGTAALSSGDGTQCPEKVITETARGGTILVVDDDPAILNLVQLMLHEIGFEALITSDADEALKIIGKREPVIDLLMIDIYMPEIDGIRLSQKVRSIDNSIKVLFMSGSSDAADKISKIESSDSILKPFSMEGLKIKLGSMLEQLSS
jgi:PAS domain S-box-containing protein